ncbi:hypothetical protein [Paludibacterium denitrificans]|uniref:Uncharacterized protein n=1 Tax=Paludibacterium denitrificans TaxID=2675226 RepID=A0A844GHI7_9NEIS|nr:hypothetical protein [Paludibacterium denitrificans]MTD33955.1 hypothetical protein [Paludibacterium denitrificans]
MLDLSNGAIIRSPANLAADDECEFFEVQWPGGEPQQVLACKIVDKLLLAAIHHWKDTGEMKGDIAMLFQDQREHLQIKFGF